MQIIVLSSLELCSVLTIQHLVTSRLFVTLAEKSPLLSDAQGGQSGTAVKRGQTL